MEPTARQTATIDKKTKDTRRKRRALPEIVLNAGIDTDPLEFTSFSSIRHKICPGIHCRTTQQDDWGKTCEGTCPANCGAILFETEPTRQAQEGQCKENDGRRKSPPGKPGGLVGGDFRTHSDFQTTSKLVPSELNAEGTASCAPLLLTIVIEKTLLPKVLIGPEIDPAVASFVPLTPV